MMNEEENKEVVYRSGLVAIVGQTNVGKSTLLNGMVGEKVSIVSDRVQTTRNVIRVILSEPEGQLVFLDTPGVHKAEGDLGKNMNKAARSAAEGVDAVLLVLDGSVAPAQVDEGWFRRLARTEVPVFFGLNKADVGSAFHGAYRRMWEQVAVEKESVVQPCWMSFSALDGAGVRGLIDGLRGVMPVGPALFPEDVLTDYPRKLNMADVIREKLFNRLHQELPHAVAVWVESIEEGEKRWRVEASVLVERHSQKGIVIGEKGRLIKKVREEAERELYEMYGVQIALKLLVKVEKNWRKNFWILKKLGYA